MKTDNWIFIYGTKGGLNSRQEDRTLGTDTVNM